MVKAKGVSEKDGDRVVPLSAGQEGNPVAAASRRGKPFRVVQAICVLALMVWAVATLATWANEETVLDSVPRVTMDDFAATFSQVYLRPPISAQGDIHGIIIDVRGSEAYSNGHIPGALSIPEGDVQTRIRNLVPGLASKVVLYCA